MQIKRVDSVRELKEYIEQLMEEGEFIWRGHSDSNWKLSTSLYRFFEEYKITDDEERIEYENKAISSFYNNFKNLNTNDQNKIKNKVDALLLMQHYGCPTRLLDFTKSPYIALYFVIWEMNNEGALLGLNATEYQERIFEKLTLDDYYGGILTFIPDRIFRSFKSDKEIDFPVPLNPDPIDKRMSIQQSIFLLDMDLTKTTEESIDENCGDILYKLQIPLSIKQQLYYELHLMNIDGHHLFKGLHGLALNAKEFLMGVKEFGYSLYGKEDYKNSETNRQNLPES